MLTVTDPAALFPKYANPPLLFVMATDPVTEFPT